MEILQKPDFQKTLERFEAWWHGEVLDRPVVTAYVLPHCAPVLGSKTHVSMLDRWLDVEFQVERAVEEMECRSYVADGFPAYCPNVGPEVTATLLGCVVDFLDERTGWAKPVVQQPEDWAKVTIESLDFTGRFWQTMTQMTNLALEMSQGRYLVGMTDLHGNYDILAALRDPQYLCMDLLDCPGAVRQASKVARQAMSEAFERNYALIAKAGMPSTCWAGFLHQGPAYIPSCDFWCMLGTAMARDEVLADIAFEMQAMKRSIFHLDGPDALKHLDMLLELDDLDAVQWVYGTGHGMASDWLEVYQRIQASGKSIQVIAQDPVDAMNCLEALNPQGLWLTLVEPFESVDQAQVFIKEVERTICQ